MQIFYKREPTQLDAAIVKLKKEQHRLACWGNALREKEARIKKEREQLEKEKSAVEIAVNKIRNAERELQLRREKLEQDEQLKQSSCDERQAQLRETLDQTAQRYRQERLLWENTMLGKPDPELSDQISENLLEVARQFKTVMDSFDSIRMVSREMVNAVQYGDRNAVQAMCEFHRRLELQQGDAFRQEAAYFAGILKKYYQLIPVEPALGSAFDPEEQERAEHNNGRIVEACLSRGWRGKDGLITCAVVRTAESLGGLEFGKGNENGHQ